MRKFYDTAELLSTIVNEGSALERDEEVSVVINSPNGRQFFAIRNAEAVDGRLVLTVQRKRPQS